jgi:hypothetical protein
MGRAVERTGKLRRRGVVDEERRVAGPVRGRRDALGVEQVEGDRDDPWVMPYLAGVTGERVHLRGAALEERLDQVAAEAACGAGHGRRGGGEVHAEIRRVAAFVDERQRQLLPRGTQVAGRFVEQGERAVLIPARQGRPAPAADLLARIGDHHRGRASSRRR